MGFSHVLELRWGLAVKDKTTGEKIADLIEVFAERILNDERSIHAKCNNEFGKNEYGIIKQCDCWRCKEIL